MNPHAVIGVSVLLTASLACGWVAPSSPTPQDQWVQNGGVQLVLGTPSGCDPAQVQSILEERLATEVATGWVVSSTPLTLNVVAPTFDVSELLRRGEIRIVPVTDEQTGVLADGHPDWLVHTDGTTLYEVDRSRSLGHEHITRVQTGHDNGMPFADVYFDDAGQQAFEQLTSDFLDQKLAVALDDVVIMAPVVRERISGGRMRISAGHSTPMGRVEMLSTRPLPCDVTVRSEARITQ